MWFPAMFRSISSVCLPRAVGCALLIFFGTLCVLPLGVKSTELVLQGTTPLALWVVGDDGVTQRLVAGIRSEIAASHDLVITDDGTSVVRMEIPVNVDVVESKGEYVVRYAVIFLDNDSRYLGGSFGGCQESRIHECVTDVIHDLRMTLKYLPKKVQIKRNFRDGG